VDLENLDSRNVSTSRIEEVLETHVLQIKEAAPSDDDEGIFSHDIFQVFAAEKKGDKPKAPELSAPPLTIQAPVATVARPVPLGPMPSSVTNLMPKINASSPSWRTIL
jgi:hypothetical protein